jgi:hypothetical protein
MTHKPPVPEASVSPYPLQDPPREQDPLPIVTVELEEESEEESESDALFNRKNVAGLVAAGVGAVGVASAIFFSTRGKQGRAGAKPRKRKAKADD